MIQTCEKCGAINQSGADNCCFCAARLGSSAEHAEVSVVSSSESAANATRTLQQDWRREVKHRLRTYRAKRGSGGDSQAALPFGSQQGDQQAAAHEADDSWQDPDDTVDEPIAQPGVLDDDQYEDPLQASLAAAAARIQVQSAPAPVAVPKPEPVQHLLIDVSAPPVVDSNVESEPVIATTADLDFEAYDRQDAPLLPVAELSLRRRAGAVDAVCLLLAFTSIMGLFAGFGGRLALGRFDAIVCAGIFALLYTQYFILFCMMGGATPGMIMTGLRLVSFDGAVPDPSQLMWRCLGYIISGGTGLMGFLWAFWDEDHLSWHDRLSHTYITANDESASAPSSMHPQQSPPAQS